MDNCVAFLAGSRLAPVESSSARPSQMPKSCAVTIHSAGEPKMDRLITLESRLVIGRLNTPPRQKLSSPIVIPLMITSLDTI